MRHETDKEFLYLTHDALDVSQALQFIILPWTGGTSLFLGTTRDCFQKKQVLTLFYEAYVPMAMKEMLNICKDIHTKFDVGRICMIHRLGEVRVTETSVVIGISSEHRANAIRAVEYAIDKLKSKVPIWKKEIYSDGDELWKENKEAAWMQQQ